MKSVLTRASVVVLSTMAGALVLACSDNDTTEPVPNPVVLRNQSVTPALVKSLVSGVEIFTLISSDDTLRNSPSFIFGGSADGSGLVKNGNGTFTALVNHEDNFSVSRITFDSTFKPVAGEYVVNSTFGKYRLCSATMATVSEHGFGPLYITAGESNEESQVLGVNPFGANNTPTYLTGFGRWNTENAVPLPKTAFPGKTVIVLGDDDSGAEGGQVVLYVANTVGDLDNGKLYALARTNDNNRERDMVVGQTYPVVFREITSHKAKTGRELNQATTALKAMMFGRVEDVDYRRDGVGREAFFTVTGQNNTGVNADYSRSKYGRVYKLTFDATDPLKANLEVLLDGDDRNGPAKTFQNPDNIVATANYLYIAEDDNGYGDEAHDGYVYQYNLASKVLTPVLLLDHRRTAADAAKYNAVGARPEGKAGWEYGAMIDISEQTGNANTFMLSLQPHSWRAVRYQNPDGGSIQVSEQQASQLVVVKGLPR
ncbi:MAG: alkaline phosphatase PhoX [Gemmatimonas sp.]